MDRKILDNVRMAYTDLLNALDEAADGANTDTQRAFFEAQLANAEALVKQYDRTVNPELEAV